MTDKGSTIVYLFVMAIIIYLIVRGLVRCEPCSNTIEYRFIPMTVDDQYELINNTEHSNDVVFYERK